MGIPASTEVAEDDPMTPSELFDVVSIRRADARYDPEAARAPSIMLGYPMTGNADGLIDGDGAVAEETPVADDATLPEDMERDVARVVCDTVDAPREDGVCRDAYTSTG